MNDIILLLFTFLIVIGIFFILHYNQKKSSTSSTATATRLFKKDELIHIDLLGQDAYKILVPIIEPAMNSLNTKMKTLVKNPIPMKGCKLDLDPLTSKTISSCFGTTLDYSKNVDIGNSVLDATLKTVCYIPCMTTYLYRELCCHLPVFDCGDCSTTICKRKCGTALQFNLGLKQISGLSSTKIEGASIAVSFIDPKTHSFTIGFTIKLTTTGIHARAEIGLDGSILNIIKIVPNISLDVYTDLEIWGNLLFYFSTKTTNLTYQKFTFEITQVHPMHSKMDYSNTALLEYVPYLDDLVAAALSGIIKSKVVPPIEAAVNNLPIDLPKDLIIPSSIIMALIPINSWCFKHQLNIIPEFNIVYNVPVSIINMHTEEGIATYVVNKNLCPRPIFFGVNCPYKHSVWAADPKFKPENDIQFHFQCIPVKGKKDVFYIKVHTVNKLWYYLTITDKDLKPMFEYNLVGITSEDKYRCEFMIQPCGVLQTATGSHYFHYKDKYIYFTDKAPSKFTSDYIFTFNPIKS